MTNLKNVRLRRTRQSTIFEIVAALCSLFSWIIVSIAVAKGRLDAEKFITISLLSLASTLYVLFGLSSRCTLDKKPLPAKDNATTHCNE